MILELIERELLQMQRIPSEQKLSEMLGVSRNTVREAIRTLEQEGVLYSRQGIGTFVIGSKDLLKTNLATLESSTKIISDHGYTPGTKHVLIDVRETPAVIADQLLISQGERQALYIERVRTANDVPVVYVEDYVPYSVGMEEHYRFGNYESLLHFLESYGHTVAFSVCTMKAVISEPKVEQKLELKEKSALLLLQQIHYSTKGEPVLYSDSYFLSDKFEFNIIRKCV